MELSTKEKEYIRKTLKVLKNVSFLTLLFLYPFFIKFFMSVIFNESFKIPFSDIQVYFYNFKHAMIQGFFYNFKYAFTDTTIFSIFRNMYKDLYVDFWLVLGIFLISIGFVKKFKPSIIITTILFIGLAITNSIVFQLRGNPFSIFDIFAIKTAFKVISNYRISISKEIILAIIITVCYVVALIYLESKRIMIKKYFRIVCIVLGMVCIIFSAKTKKVDKVNYWSLKEAYSSDGQNAVFMKQINDLLNDNKPSNYSKEKAIEILSNYSDDDELEDNLKVIVIMNESFSDLNSVYNFGFEDNIPFFNSLKENTIRGKYYTSFIGGSTANVEWEFLTGNSYAFVPNGTYPYIQNVVSHKENIADIYNRIGLNTLAFHPYYKSSYNRNVVYEMLGFKNIFFVEDFDNLSKLDKDAYNILLEKMDKQKTTFNFLVTMQNHAPYDEIDGVSEDRELNGYLEKIHESDIALEELINKLENREEKIALLFFGDHQPYFVEKYDNSDNKNYEMSFIIWTNFDIEEKEGVTASANYLYNIFANVVNLPKSQYQNYIEHVREKIPVLTKNGYYGDDGMFYKIDDEETPYVDLLEEYSIVQYYEMFDKK